ncbi:MAG: alpha/beta hydrolase [Tetrasphaera sp.]
MSIETVVTDDGCQLWSEVRGHGNAIVLNHVGPGLADNLGALQERLAPSHRVVRWDQRGCGRSEPRGPYSIERSVADLSAIVARQGGRAVLVGHSWGVTLSLHYTLARPESVRALVYVSGTGTGQGWKPEWRRTAASRMGPEQLARVTGLASRGRSAAEDRELACSINHDCKVAINAETSLIRETDLLDRCRSLSLPVLVVQGPRRPATRGCDAFDAMLREFLDDEK